jgi:putative methionine-R-sulfoxide reductase with GAF domain
MTDLAVHVEELIGRGGEADDVLRAVVSALAGTPEIAWAGVAFVEEADLVVGPAAGEPNPALRARVPISFQGSAVGELWVDGAVPADDVQRVAALIAPLVLIGWDTGGEAWEP